MGGRNVLIMTATIAPPTNAPGLARADPEVRLNDYLEGLRFYSRFLGKTIDHIIFAENSDADLQPLKQLAGILNIAESVEFLKCTAREALPNFGRCIGEMDILDQVMSSCQAVDRHDNVYWKVTGRYKIINLATVVASRPANCQLYCDMRNATYPWLDMRVMAWNIVGYDTYLRGIVDDIVNDTQNSRFGGEDSAYFAVKARLLGNDPVQLSYLREPLIDGVRAFDNQNWSKGRQRLVYHLRDFQRLIFGKSLV